MTWDLIYLDKHGDADHYPQSWTYYRIRSTTGLGIPAGDLGSSVQVCRVKWPTFEDIDPPTDTPGVVGYTSAEYNANKLLEQWGVDRKRSILIGSLVREDIAEVKNYNDGVKLMLATAAEKGFQHPLYISVRSANGITQAYRMDGPNQVPKRLSGDDADLTFPIKLIVSDRTELDTGDRMLLAEFKRRDSDGMLQLNIDELRYDPKRQMN